MVKTVETGRDSVGGPCVEMAGRGMIRITRFATDERSGSADYGPHLIWCCGSAGEAPLCERQNVCDDKF